MPARRFIGYFLALSACSTIAFASSLMGQPPVPDDQSGIATDLTMPMLMPYAPGHLPLHKIALRHAQLALAE
jgi:hypothetical protein